ncbi:MAG: hypothetical protein WAU28_03665, partial [Candidatus Moraniibacteriota bacterium]
MLCVFKQTQYIFHSLSQSINIFFRRIHPKTNPCRSGEVEGSVEWCCAVLTGTDTDISLAEEFGEVVRVYAFDGEGDDGGSFFDIRWTEYVYRVT